MTVVKTSQLTVAPKTLSIPKNTTVTISNAPITKETSTTISVSSKNSVSLISSKPSIGSSVTSQTASTSVSSVPTTSTSNASINTATTSEQNSNQNTNTSNANASTNQSTNSSVTLLNNSVPSISTIESTSQAGNINGKIERASLSSQQQIAITNAEDSEKENNSNLTYEQAANSNEKNISKEDIKSANIASNILKSITTVSTDIVTDENKCSNSKIKIPPATSLSVIKNATIITKESTIKDNSPILMPTPTIPSIKKQTTSYFSSTVITSSMIHGESEITTETHSTTFSEPVLFSASFAIDSDIFNIDTLTKDLRSYSGELLSSFDQLVSTPECEIIALIKNPNTNTVVVVFRMGDFDQFSCKVYDMFFDRKVFWNGYSTLETADDFLKSTFVDEAPPMEEPTDTLSFTRDQAKQAVVRNKNLINSSGINTDLNYVIFGEADDKIKATRLLEIGAFDYQYNPVIQNDNIFVHKIYGISISIPSLSMATPIISSSIGFSPEISFTSIGT